MLKRHLSCWLKKCSEDRTRWKCYDYSICKLPKSDLYGPAYTKYKGASYLVSNSSCDLHNERWFWRDNEYDPLRNHPRTPWFTDMWIGWTLSHYGPTEFWLRMMVQCDMSFIYYPWFQILQNNMYFMNPDGCLNLSLLEKLVLRIPRW